MKNRNFLEDDLREMQREAEEEFGVWCGGVATSAVAICRENGAKVVFRPVKGQRGDLPHEGRKAIFCRGNDRVTLTQHWHGGPESGDWWWVL